MVLRVELQMKHTFLNVGQSYSYKIFADEIGDHLNICSSNSSDAGLEIILFDILNCCLIKLLKKLIKNVVSRVFMEDEKKMLTNR